MTRHFSTDIPSRLPCLDELRTHLNVLIHDFPEDQRLSLSLGFASELVEGAAYEAARGSNSDVTPHLILVAAQLDRMSQRLWKEAA